MKIPQEVIDKFDVKPIEKLNELSGYMRFFSGKRNYEDALTDAYAWRDEFNSKSKTFKIEFVKYFAQEFNHKSIFMQFKFV